MLSILDAYTEELPPTKTYGVRTLCFIPANHEHPAWDGRLGNLILKLQHAKSGVHRNVEIDTYAIEQDTPEPGDNGGAAFWFNNLTDASQEQPYRCIVGGLNPLPKCSCQAGKCKVPGIPDCSEGCKHKDGILHLIAEGLIEVIEYGHNVTNETAPSGDEHGSLQFAHERKGAEPNRGRQGSWSNSENNHSMGYGKNPDFRAACFAHPRTPQEETIVEENIRKSFLPDLEVVTFLH